MWNYIFLLNCLLSALMYPFFMIYDNDVILSVFLWPQIFFEGVFAIDMAISFFKQELMEDETSKCEPIEVVAHRYLTTKFIYDLLIMAPWGLLFTYFDPKLRFMWVIKALRLRVLRD